MSDPASKLPPESRFESRFESTLDDKWYYRPSGVLLLIGLYCFAHIALRLGTSWNLGENDPQSLLHTQSFQWMYAPLEMPLWDWSAILMTKVFGVNALSFQLMRYGFLAIALFFVYLTARKMTGSGLWALLTLEAYALIYQLSWRMHEGFTHPQLAFVGLALLFYGSVLFWQKRHDRRALIFVVAGVVIGSLSNLWFCGFVTVYIAVLVVSFRNCKTLPVVGAISLGLVPAICIVFLGFGFGQTFTALQTQFLHEGGIANGAKLMSDGFLTLAPLIPLVFVFFPQIFKMKWSGLSLSAQIAGLTGVLGLIVLAFVGVSGLEAPPEHATLPLFFLVPLFFIAAIQQVQPKPFQIKAFTGLCLVLMVVAFGIRAANLIVNQPVCNKCYFAIPYDALAARLSEKFKVRDIALVAPDRRLAGNLMAHGGEAAFKSYSRYLTAGHHSQETLIIVDAQQAAYLDVVLEKRGLARNDVKLTEISVPWQHLWRKDGYKVSNFIALHLPLQQQ